MRYTVLTFRTFHHRIARYLGVLVAASLVATLGLPSVAQAQALNAPMVTHSSSGITITWTNMGPLGGAVMPNQIDNWILTVYAPTGTTVMGIAASESTYIGSLAEGTWRATVVACHDPGSDVAPIEDDDLKTATSCATGTTPIESKMGMYSHGAPPTPENFRASFFDGVITLRWTYVDGKDDAGLGAYKLKTNDVKALTDLPGKGVHTILDPKPGEYMFALTRDGETDNELQTGKVVSGAATASVTVPMPTPTLPEITLLLLAMLLLGSGAYLLRGRQSGGLTHA